MKMILATLIAILLLPGSALAAYTIEDYNGNLPSWGTSWYAGSGSVNGYYPSFYTGFAMRSSFPERIHIRTARGNQTRVSVVLDEETVSDYLFDLVKRYEFYRLATSTRSGQSRPMAGTEPARAAVLPQLGYFNRIIESGEYNILSFVNRARTGTVSPEEIYRKSLDTLQRLNPGRIFLLRINLSREFGRWRSQMRATLPAASDLKSHFSSNPRDTVIALNSLVWGRVNHTEKPTEDLVGRLAALAALALSDMDEEPFIRSAFDLFRRITAGKYDFRVLDEAGRWRPALHCPDSGNCTLSYPEFTAIYPTGSVKSSINDGKGNKIPTYATPGLWQFLSRGNRHDVDNIRDESYYGWAPKLDFEAIGNGFHNPAVRFVNVGKTIKNALGIPSDHATFWAVKRGGVSSGCLRLPLGHVWEMRHIFPVQNEKMVQVHFFGNDPRDFDVYDIDGDGDLELMGVEYLISYGLQGTGGLAKREGANLEIGAEGKLSFYHSLYGTRSVFSLERGGKFSFESPTVSIPSYLDFKKKRVTARISVNGTVPLYEQAYERDKVQFYTPYTTDGLTTPGKHPLSKRIARIMGRVRGCAPRTDKARCGESAFDHEANGLFRELR